MLAYLATKEQFLTDAPNVAQKVHDLVLQNLGIEVSDREKQAWRNSIDGPMFFIVRDPRFPDNSAIAIEYRINRTKNRIDFLIAGTDSSGKEALLVIELKQWSNIDESKLDDCVKTWLGGRKTDEEHPSSQARGYMKRLQNMNSYIQQRSVGISACSYLHNCETDAVLRSEKFSDLCDKHPVFIAGESDNLLNFVHSRISQGVGVELLRRIDESPSLPATPLANAVGGMLKGQSEFVLMDEQKIAFESIVAAGMHKNDKKQVLIIQGGPGTGKSVVAINALARLMSKQKNVQYVTANKAPRDVFKEKLKDSLDRDFLKLLFTTSAGFGTAEENCYDMLLVDEAHRLKERAFTEPSGTNQIRAIIRASQTTVFFVDDSQQVTLQDAGSTEAIRAIAREFDAEIQEFTLQAQFRCNGSDEYLDWLDNLLKVRENEQRRLTSKEFDFQVFDDPRELHEAIKQKNLENNRSRMVAGYCWDWVSKRDSSIYDIRMPQYKYEARWNLEDYGGTFVIDPESVAEVGCIHTCQGLELDYVGVIVGPDLTLNSGELVTNPEARASTDKSLHGYKTALKSQPSAARARADRIVRNTYRTLMTRGMKGCYVHFTDAATAEHFREHLV